MAPIARQFDKTNSVAPYYIVESGSEQFPSRKNQERVSAADVCQADYSRGTRLALRNLVV
jgi:hypothetical protein